MQSDDRKTKRARDKRVVRTHAAIRQAMHNLLLEVDYDDITVTKLAHEAGIDRKTFYLHYDGVADVLNEAVQEHADVIVGRVAAIPYDDKGEIDFTAFFIDLSVEIAQFVANNQRLVQHFSSTLLLDVIENSLTACLIANESLDIDPAAGPYIDYCVSFMCAGVLAVYRRWMTTESDIPLEDLATLVGTIVRNGLQGVERRQIKLFLKRC